MFDYEEAPRPYRSVSPIIKVLFTLLVLDFLYRMWPVLKAWF
jgi:hypothetical protein